MFKVLSKRTKEFLSKSQKLSKDNTISEEDLKNVLQQRAIQINGDSSNETINKQIENLLKDKIIENYGQNKPQILPQIKHSIRENETTDRKENQNS